MSLDAGGMSTSAREEEGEQEEDGPGAGRKSDLHPTRMTGMLGLQIEHNGVVLVAAFAGCHTFMRNCQTGV